MPLRSKVLVQWIMEEEAAASLTGTGLGHAARLFFINVDVKIFWISLL